MSTFSVGGNSDSRHTTGTYYSSQIFCKSKFLSPFHRDNVLQDMPSYFIET